MHSCGPPHMANQKQDGQLEHTYSSYVMIRDVTLKTCQRRWMIGRRGDRESGISLLAAHDDDIFVFCVCVHEWAYTLYMHSLLHLYLFKFFSMDIVISFSSTYYLLYIYIYIYIYVCVCVCVCVCPFVYVCTYICVYTNVLCMHTHAHFQGQWGDLMCVRIYFTRHIDVF